MKIVDINFQYLHDTFEEVERALAAEDDIPTMIKALVAYSLANATLSEVLPKGRALHAKASGAAGTAALMLQYPEQVPPTPNLPSYAAHGFIGTAIAQYEKMFDPHFGRHPLNGADRVHPPATAPVMYLEVGDAEA